MDNTVIDELRERIEAHRTACDQAYRRLFSDYGISYYFTEDDLDDLIDYGVFDDADEFDETVVAQRVTAWSLLEELVSRIHVHVLTDVLPSLIMVDCAHLSVDEVIDAKKFLKIHPDLIQMIADHVAYLPSVFIEDRPYAFDGRISEAPSVYIGDHTGMFVQLVPSVGGGVDTLCYPTFFLRHATRGVDSQYVLDLECTSLQWATELCDHSWVAGLRERLEREAVLGLNLHPRPTDGQASPMELVRRWSRLTRASARWEQAAIEQEQEQIRQGFLRLVSLGSGRQVPADEELYVRFRTTDGICRSLNTVLGYGWFTDNPYPYDTMHQLWEYIDSQMALGSGDMPGVTDSFVTIAGMSVLRAFSRADGNMVSLSTLEEPGEESQRIKVSITVGGAFGRQVVLEITVTVSESEPGTAFYVRLALCLPNGRRTSCVNHIALHELISREIASPLEMLRRRMHDALWTLIQRVDRSDLYLLSGWASREEFENALFVRQLIAGGVSYDDAVRQYGLRWRHNLAARLLAHYPVSQAHDLT